jgi:hypothetical protein
VPTRRGSQRRERVCLSISRQRPGVAALVVSHGKQIHDLATLIYVDIGLECERCHRRFHEPGGDTETGVWQWSQDTAVEAHRAGWREVSGRPFCLDCAEQYEKNG